VIDALAAGELRRRIGDEGGSHQRHRQGVVVGHLGDDDEGGDRRLHHSGEIGDHSEEDERAERRGRKERRHIDAEPGADGERRREDAARNAADRRQRRRRQLEQAEALGQLRATAWKAS
jgi:hypothetical protein